MLNQLYNRQTWRFLVAGGIAAFVNILVIFILVEKLNFNTFLLRNIANFIAVEISLIVSFFLYRSLVWRGGKWLFKRFILQQLPLYRVASNLAVLTRVLLIFPLLDKLGVPYSINTFIGILCSVTINYLFRDRFIFNNTFGKNLYPEALAPALMDGSLSQAKNTPSLTASTVPISLFSLVIPAYNEEGCIASTIAAIAQQLDSHQIDYEILVVNDNSKDRTEAILQKITAQNPKVRYINNYYPNGFGFAVRCGLENFSGDAIAVVMGDCSDSPENIVDYYNKLNEGYECVFGSRFIKGGRVRDYPGHKLLINRLANQFVAVLFNLSYNDTTNAFKAYRREVIAGISPLLSHHFNLTVEMPLKAMIRGYNYAVVPITWQNRKTGVSKLKIKEMGSRYLFIVLYLFLEKILARGDYLRPELKNIKVLPHNISNHE